MEAGTEFGVFCWLRPCLLALSTDSFGRRTLNVAWFSVSHDSDVPLITAARKFPLLLYEFSSSRICPPLLACSSVACLLPVGDGKGEDSFGVWDIGRG
jgi:hypothetical protein